MAIYIKIVIISNNIGNRNDKIPMFNAYVHLQYSSNNNNNMLFGGNRK